MNHRQRHPRAFTVLELLFYLGLISTFASIAGGVFHSSLRLTTDATEAQSTLARFDSAVALLRADVWNAQAVQTPNPREVWLDCGGGEKITWRVDESSLLRRSISHGEPEASHQEWPDMPSSLTFAADDGALLVRTTGPDKSTDELRLTSQLQPARRRP